MMWFLSIAGTFAGPTATRCCACTTRPTESSPSPSRSRSGHGPANSSNASLKNSRNAVSSCEQELAGKTTRRISLARTKKAGYHGRSDLESTRFARAGRSGGAVRSDRFGHAPGRGSIHEATQGKGPRGAEGQKNAREKSAAAHARPLGRLRRQYETGGDLRLQPARRRG